MRFIKIPFGLIILFLAFLSLAASTKAVITAVLIQPGTEKTNFIFTMTQKTSGTVKFVDNPNRVIIDFTNTTKSFSMANARLGGANVTSLSTEDTPNGVRIILLVKDKVTWRTEFLPNDKTNAIRFQIEILSPTKNNQETPPPKETSTTLKEQTMNVDDDEQAWVGKSRLENSNITKSKDKFIVVIDAGHGGQDPGAKGYRGTQEKAIVLAIAKRLARYINQSKNMQAYLTRDGDYFVPLRNRLHRARAENADLFIAIHADAYFKDEAGGASVYALSQRGATTEAALWLAEQENYSELDGIELNRLKDHSLLLRKVLIDLAQTATIRHSLRLGNEVLDALDDCSSIHHRNVEQAPFMVLKSPDIPSILVETGFITNPNEEKRLQDAQYQERIASAIWKGINQYVQKYASF